MSNGEGIPVMLKKFQKRYRVTAYLCGKSEDYQHCQQFDTLNSFLTKFVKDCTCLCWRAV